MVLNSVKVKVKPESSFFSVGNKKKSAGARSGEWGGWGISWMEFFARKVCTTSAV
jgi:hypothetical protein